MPTDFYTVLGVERTATEREILTAYRGLARKYHPDVAEDKARAEVHFKEINEAYEVLSDASKREHYDRFGSAPGAQPQGSPFGGGEGISDIFDMFFGGRGGAQQQRPGGPQRGSDRRYDMHVTLEEAFAGVEREIAFDHLAACDTCAGSGAKPGTVVSACDRCGGSGAMQAVRSTPLGRFVTQTTCTKCSGEGTIVPSPCETCRGRGRVAKTRTLSVRVPAGVDDGSRIRVTGSGDGGMHGGGPGDLIVFLDVARHERYRRDGGDLYVEEQITFAQAALGAEIEVEALDGPVPVTVAGGTQPGSTYRLRGKGMPTVRGASRGDLYATLHVRVPKHLGRRERELLEELAAIEAEPEAERSFFGRVKDAFRPE